VGTVGILEAQPGSRNVIPGEVFFTIDMRHAQDAVIDAMESEVRAAIDMIAAEEGLGVTFERIWNATAVPFDACCIAAVREGAARAGLSSHDIVSGAGHDSAYIARIAPTAMIFVPCAGGLSHNEAESTTREECAAGTQVLLNAVLAYDARA
jgi:N-carbamoyl-L-amino-acid hydrolase